MAPLIKAIQFNRLDVMQLLLEHGADLEIEGHKVGTPVCVAGNGFRPEAAALLLEYGADVNYRQKHGRTVLFTAIITKQIELIEVLLSYGADVNVFADYKNSGRFHNANEGYSPLQAALRSFRNMPKRLLGGFRETELAPCHFAAHLAILKLLVPRCDSFDLILTDSDDSTYRIEPCVVQSFQTELKLGFDDDFTITKYLLRNGAVAKFSKFFDCLVKSKSSFKPLTMSLLQLLLLAGCEFDTYFSAKLKTKEQVCDDHTKLLWYDKHIQPVLDKVDDLLSQPLPLQELSIVTIRQCIGSRQLWAKIDSLPVPPLVKDKIKLKTYSPDKNGSFYVNSRKPLPPHLLLYSVMGSFQTSWTFRCFNPRTCNSCYYSSV